MQNLGKLPSTMFGYDDIVWIYSLSESGFIIKIIDKNFAKTFNRFFEFFWINRESV